MSLQDWFKSLRKWIDGEDDLDEQGEPKPRSKWEDFLVAVARDVEKSMQEEMFTPPGGPTYIPREYVVFLSPTDDAKWQGEKREGLQRGLYHVLSERARELVGEKDFQTKTFSVELRVDGALEAGRFRVQHIWDNQSEKTMVKPRRVEKAAPAGTGSLETTVVVDKEEEATIVRPRPSKTPIFSVEIRRRVPGADTSPPDIRAFNKNDITIGRGSKQVAVDLKLEGDLEISRRHATLTKRMDGTYLIACQGANSIILDGGREVPVGQSLEVQPGEIIAICSYELKITEPEQDEDTQTPN
jgi:hypothetical protein